MSLKNKVIVYSGEVVTWSFVLATLWWPINAIAHSTFSEDVFLYFNRSLMCLHHIYLGIYTFI